jgi:hypothetical protein
MKRILFAFVVVLCTISAQAQGFQPEIRLGCDFGIDADQNNSYGADIILGYRFMSKFRLGVGVGINGVDLLFEDAGLTSIGNNWFDSEGYRETALSIPIFVNAKINFIDTPIAPFFSIDLGYNHYIASSDYAEANKLGLFATPAVGVDFHVGKKQGAIVLQVGYHYQVRKCDKWFDPLGNYSQLSFKIGYQF